jgi:hypothetical protein
MDHFLGRILLGFFFPITVWIKLKNTLNKKENNEGAIKGQDRRNVHAYAFGSNYVENAWLPQSTLTYLEKTL